MDRNKLSLLSLVRHLSPQVQSCKKSLYCALREKIVSSRTSQENDAKADMKLKVLALSDLFLTVVAAAYE